MGLIRLFLACVVAFDHWRVLVTKPARMQLGDWTNLGLNAGYAVMFFYVISGFLITYTLSRNYGPGEIRKFYVNRFIRIFSVYWPLVGIVLVMVPGAWSALADANLIDKATAIFLFGVDWSVTFGQPGGQYFNGVIKTIPQSWTLGAELTFYVMAPLLMKSWRAAAALLCASLALRAGFIIANGTGLQTWTYTFFPTTLCFFLLGHLIMRAGDRWALLRSRYVGITALTVAALVMLFGSRNGFDSLRFWSSILLFTAALPGLFEATKRIGWMNWLGNLSYPLYLIHITLIGIVGAWLQSFSWSSGDIGPYVTLFTFGAVAIGVSAVVHIVLERPASLLLHRVFGGRTSAVGR